MDIYRAFLAIVISFLILIGYQYFFVAPVPVAVVEQPAAQVAQTAPLPSPVATLTKPAVLPGEAQGVRPDRAAREIGVETDLFRAVVSEDGGTLRSFVLKDFREDIAKDSPGMQLVRTVADQGFPLAFSWGSAAGSELFYSAPEGTTAIAGDGQLTMTAQTTTGLSIERVYSFARDSYLFDLEVRVTNNSDQALQGSAELHQVNLPFGEVNQANRFLFMGPSLYLNGQYEEYKTKVLENGPLTVQGGVDWAAYGDRYFMGALIPAAGQVTGVVMQQLGDLVQMRLDGPLDTLQPGEEKVYHYRAFYGPKKLSLLKESGYNLDRAVNFGWFDVLAKPTLWLLNVLHGVFKNYGIAIILVTVTFKAIFWPITQKGMKSMKNMQKLQPKMVKIKEKYKSDPTKMNQEVMNLYKTYKVNPLGGCLPMVLQIPVFFALYKVLLQCIELRHAPFMLWITDLSAPDRLWIGFDIPYLGGIPVLTLLMGASMFLQQKMTPTTADPTQAKIMMFLPVIFTFMFINFASGLVLYWFVNNLLAIFQQQMINRQKH